PLSYAVLLLLPCYSRASPCTTLFRSALARRPTSAPRPTTATAMPQRTLPPSRTPASPCPIPDRSLPGTELAPGLHYLERHPGLRSEEHTSELQSRENLVCRLLLEKKK